jgi:hypothetical protein
VIHLEIPAKIKNCLHTFLSVKVLEKRHILRENKAQYVKREKEVFTMLSKHNHPFFIKMYFTFQDPERLCILPYRDFCNPKVLFAQLVNLVYDMGLFIPVNHFKNRESVVVHCILKPS